MIKFLKFVPVQLTFFLILGILTGNVMFFHPIHFVGVFAVLLLFLVIVYFLSNKYFNGFVNLFTVLVFTISFFIGVGAITFKNQLNNKKHYSNSLNFHPNYASKAIFKIVKELKSNSYYNRFEATVIQFQNHQSIGKILLNIKKDSLIETLIIDDEIIVRAEFKGVQKPLNPYSFDYKKYLKNQQIHHQVFLTKPQFFKRLKKDKTIYGLAAIIRSEINSSLKNNGFKNDELAVINALLLGQRQSISNDLMEDFIDAGAIHILAVSGLHIGVILMLLVFLFKPIHSLKNGKLIATVLIILLLWFYAVIAGLSASVVRAVAMFTALSIGMHLNKPSNVYNTLVISMFFLLLFNPYYLFEVGFQLSYAAVFSIVWIQPKLYQLISIKWWILDKGWQLFSVSIAAQIGILPLSLFYFHQFPGLFFIANLVIIPFLGFILIAGIVVISMSLLNILPAIVADFYIFIIQQMNAVVSWVSSIEYFIIQNISVSIVVMLVSYLSIILVLKWLEKTTFFRLILVFISIIIIQSVFIFEKMKRQSTNEFIVFNKGNSSMFGERIGSKITFFNSENVLNERISNSYLTGAGLKDVSSLQGIKKLYNFNNEKIVIIDSLGIYNFKTIRPTIFILQQSPKINLERLLKLHKPSLIIADGSNYKSVIKNWEETCLKNKTPFYNTMQKGAYVIKE